MRIIKIIAVLLAFTTYGQAQSKTKTSKQTRTIEINNDNGELSLSFEEGVIKEFIVNGDPVDKDQYDTYQEIIDQFSNDGVQQPTPPTPPTTENHQSEKLYAMMIEYLMDEGIINSATKYKVQLKRKYMKVDGKKVSNLIHHECLDFFDNIYGHRLNFESEVELERTGENSRSSISILE